MRPDGARRARRRCRASTTYTRCPCEVSGVATVTRLRGAGNGGDVMRVVDLAETFDRFAEAWSPKIVGDVNDMHVKVVKVRGEFVWHHHDAEDELFLVVAGRLRMQLRDGDRDVGPGQFIIVPRGVEHCPKTLTEEVHLMLLEPKSTLNTGDVKNERTV